MTKPRSISRFSILVLAAPLVALPATSALAGEPTTEAEARAAAERHQETANWADSLGGTGYKTGLVQRSEAEARRCSALADALAAPATASTLEQQRLDERLALARSMGGLGYKTGLVQSVEAERKQLEAAPVAAQPERPAVPCSD